VRPYRQPLEDGEASLQQAALPTGPMGVFEGASCSERAHLDDTDGMARTDVSKSRPWRTRPGSAPLLRLGSTTAVAPMVRTCCLLVTGAAGIWCGRSSKMSQLLQYNCMRSISCLPCEHATCKFMCRIMASKAAANPHVNLPPGHARDGLQARDVRAQSRTSCAVLPWAQCIMSIWFPLTTQTRAGHVLSKA
jgi:hypothetical protein